MSEQNTSRIRVTSGYQSRTTPYIPEGDYDPADIRLHDQAAFLIESGRAVYLDANGQPTQSALEGAPDRDLAGNPIVVNLPKEQGLLTNAVVPIWQQFPNNADASQIIQPYEIGATVPAVVQGAEEKIAARPEVKTQAQAEVETQAVSSAMGEAQQVRQQAAADADTSAAQESDKVAAERGMAQAEAESEAETPKRTSGRKS